MIFRKNPGFTLMITISFFTQIMGQTQFSIEGPRTPTSDPLAEIKTGSESGILTLGLSVQAISNLVGTGIAGQFTGSSAGIVGSGFNIFGVQGSSESGIGVKGLSQNSFGGYFINDSKNNSDLVIGGNLTNANGIISSDPDFSGSSLFIRSNNSLLLQLDHDNNGDAFFTLQNGSGSAILSIGESGDMSLGGNSNLNQPHLLITETESNDFARLRLKSTSTNDYWDIAGGGALNNELNIYRSNVGNVVQFHAIGNPITTASGAYLSSAGVWTNAPAPISPARNLLEKVDHKSILEALSALPMYYWNSPAKLRTRHLTPSSEDFYSAFGLGEDNRHLAPSDMAAVALVAIQELMGENNNLRQEIEQIKRQLELLTAQQ